MISAVELELAVEHLEAHGLVTDLAVPTLAEPGRHWCFMEALARRRGRRHCSLSMVSVPAHGAVWAIFEPPGRSASAEVQAIRRAVREGGMDSVWTRTGA